MIKMLATSLALVGLLCAAVTVAAGGVGLALAPQLDIVKAFDATVVKLNVTPGDEAVVAEWTYRNHGAIPLEVAGFDQSCGCLTALADHPAIAPGKSGTIRAAFSPGAYRGLLRKSLHVRFVGFNKAVELVAEFTIPSPIQLSLQQLDWKAGDKPTAKVIELTTGTATDFSIKGLIGLPENQFTLTTETLIPRRHYRLTITPSATATGQHILQIHTDSADPRDRVKAAFLHLQAGPATAIVSPIGSP